MSSTNAARRERRIKQRQEREELNRKSRAVFEKRQRNKRFLNFGIILIIGIFAIWGLAQLVKPEQAGAYDELAQCLSSAGVTMYGTDWCPHCQAQKRLFGNSFQYVRYVNCDANRPACDSAGVEGYPTWVFPTGENLAGEQSLETLAARAGCVLGPSP